MWCGLVRACACLLSPFLLLQDVVAARDLETTFDMIGGLGDLREEIMDIVSFHDVKYFRGASELRRFRAVHAPLSWLLAPWLPQHAIDPKHERRFYLVCIFLFMRGWLLL